MCATNVRLTTCHPLERLLYSSRLQADQSVCNVQHEQKQRHNSAFTILIVVRHTYTCNPFQKHATTALSSPPAPPPSLLPLPHSPTFLQQSTHLLQTQPHGFRIYSPDHHPPNHTDYSVTDKGPTRRQRLHHRQKCQSYDRIRAPVRRSRYRRT